MSDTAPAVALLFDDVELVVQLREALHERGARIVHEGGVSSLSHQLLQQVGADVLVVNLDDSADDALDQLHAVIHDDRPRVVFNDAQASRALVGWDRARWARHLAVKVLAAGDIDPPRPEDARRVETPVAAQPVEVHPAEVAAMDADAPAEIADTATAKAEDVVEHASTPVVDSEPDFPVHDHADAQQEQAVSAESENLAAELEALLAFSELPADDERESGSGLRFSEDDELPPLHDGHFGVPAAMLDGVSDEPVVTFAEADEEAAPQRAALPAFQFDHLQLSPMTDSSIDAIPVATIESLPTDAVTAIRAPDNWALLDDDALLDTAASFGKDDATNFGIEKLSAADFLAPDVEQVSAGIEPTMSLELVSMEEAVAPKAYVHDHTMVLDDFDTALSRIVLTAAAVSGIASVCVFLAALPATTRLTFLHTQHLGDQSDVALVKKLATHSTLPVRLAGHGIRAKVGEVVVVPAGMQARLRRDGSIELQANGRDADAPQDPSIDATLTMAANAFGRDALAIVFAGGGNDSVAGAQAVHDRGGQVWVESSSGEHFAGMVSGIFAERLVSFSGAPHELAAHLIEVFP